MCVFYILLHDLKRKMREKKERENTKYNTESRKREREREREILSKKNRKGGFAWILLKHACNASQSDLGCVCVSVCECVCECVCVVTVVRVYV